MTARAKPSRASQSQRREVEEERDPGTRRRVGGWPIAAAIALVLGFLYYVRQILLPFVLAAAIAFVMTPLVDLLHRRVGWLPRWAAAVLLYLVLLAALGALFYLMGTLIVSDMARIAREAPQIIARTVEQLMGSGADVLGQHLDPRTVTQNVTDRLKAFLESGEAVSIAAFGLTALFSTFLAAVLVLYFLISGARIVKGTLWLVPPEHRPEVAAMLAKVAPLLRRYLIGLACIVLYATSAAWIGFGAIFELPHAPLLAVIVGILELIPVIGPILSALLVGVTALQQSSIWAAAGLAGFAFLLRLSIDQLVGPLVLGKAASVHPVVVIFAFLSGAVMFGIIGLILAVPVAATIRMVLAHYYAEPIQE